jgi:parallel beta-helix repeat protein
MKRIFIALVMLVALPFVPARASINVSTAAELTSAMKTAVSGDVITMRGGLYEAPATGWQFQNAGVTLVNYPGEQVVLRQSRMNVSGNYIIKCLLSSPAVDGNKILGSDVGGQKGIVMQGVTGAIAPAILGYQCDNWEVSGVEFRDVGYAVFQRKVDNGNTSADRWYVHDNWVSDYFRESGMQFNGNGNRIENNVITKQTAQYTSTYGCQLLNLLGNNNTVRGNVLTRVDQSVRCIGIFFEWDLADNNVIENNVIAGVVNGISFFGGDNNIIRNNKISGTDTAFILRSWADNVTAYPCNFSSFMPLESDTANPDWQYMYPHDCRSKSNRFENNTVSGFGRFSMVDLPESSNVFVVVTPATSTATNTVTPTPTIVPPADTRMLIPLYTSPANWGQVVKANIGNVIDVIINPGNGVGPSRQTLFVNGIATLRSDDIGVFGYIATTYGDRSISAVKAEVDTWQSWYAPDGIFLDEVSNTNDPVKLAYYGELYSYIRAKGLAVIHNPGGSTVEAYMSVSDVSCIYETAPVSPIPSPSWGVPAKLCALSFNASREQMISFVNEGKGRFAYLYVTNDTLGNPWDVLPSYLAEEAALLAGVVIPTPSETMTATATITATPTNTVTRTPTIIPSSTPTRTPTTIPSSTPTRTATPVPATSTPTALPTVCVPAYKLCLVPMP